MNAQQTVQIVLDLAMNFAKAVDTVTTLTERLEKAEMKIAALEEMGREFINADAVNSAIEEHLNGMEIPDLRDVQRMIEEHINESEVVDKDDVQRMIEEAYNETIDEDRVNELISEALDNAADDDDKIDETRVEEMINDALAENEGEIKQMIHTEIVGPGFADHIGEVVRDAIADGGLTRTEEFIAGMIRKAIIDNNVAVAAALSEMR